MHFRTCIALAVLGMLPPAHGFHGVRLLTEGNGPGRTGWMKDEKVFTLANVKDMKLLWKVKLDSQPRRCTTSSRRSSRERDHGARPARDRDGRRHSDDLFGIDVATGDLLWKKQFENTFAPATEPATHALPGRPDGEAGDGTGVPGKHTIYAIAWDGRSARSTWPTVRTSPRPRSSCLPTASPTP